VDIARVEALRKDAVAGAGAVRKSKRAGADKVILQEDSAPGHGYDNRHHGNPTAIHDRLVAGALSTPDLRFPVNFPLWWTSVKGFLAGKSQNGS